MIYALLLASLLLYLAFPNYLSHWGMPSLAWLFAMPLCWLLQDQPLLKRAGLAIGVGALFFSGFVSWLAPYSIYGYLGFVIILSSQFLIFGLLFKPLFSDHRLNLIYAPAAWVTAEYFHEAFIMNGFSWTVGHSQAFDPFLIQIAAWTGSHGLSFVLILVGYSLLCLTKDFRRRNFYLSVILTIPLCLYIFGLWSLKSASNTTAPILSATLLQPNISSNERRDPDAVSSLIEKHIKLTEKTLSEKQQKPDLIVWPETAVTDDILQKEYHQKLTQYLKRTGVNILLGSALLRDGKDYNSAVLFNSHGELLKTYDKIHVVPFAEHVPENSLAQWMAKKFRRNTFDFYPGQSLGLFTLNNKQFGVAICSEDHYPKLFRKLKNSGAQFSIVLLNDGWFPQNSALVIHAQASIMRAVENNFSVLRVANTGLTLHASPKGNVDINHSPTFNTSGFQFINVRSSPSKTFYSKYGDIFARLCVCFVIINFVMPLLKRKTTVTTITFAALFLNFSAGNTSAGGAAARSGQQKQMIQQKQMQQQMIQRRMMEQAVQQKTLQQQAVQVEGQVQAQINQNAEVKAVSDLDHVVEALNQSGRNWTLIIDQYAKELIIAEYITMYRDRGIIIRRPPSHYAMMIDGMSQGSPNMLDNPFPNILQIVAIMEYDFDNGGNKDEMARKILGEQGYRQNLERLRSQSQ